MSNARVYGSVIDEHGVRHEASGVIDGTFARNKGGWDTNTTCGRYIGLAVETDLDLVVTCLRCIGKARPDGILRGKTADMVIIDEAQDFDRFKDLEDCVVVGRATQSVAETPSVLRRPSRARRRATRRC